MDLMARINDHLTRQTISKFKKKNPEIDIADDKVVHEMICDKLNILNKMTSEQRKYVLSAISEDCPIFSDMRKYNELEEMINSKIEIVQTQKGDNYPNLDKIYHILGSSSYEKSLQKYLNPRGISRYELLRFSEFVVENEHRFEKIIPKNRIGLYSLLGISLNKLTKCFVYISDYVDPENYSLPLTSLLTSKVDIGIINKLSDLDLVSILDFLNSENAEERKHILPFIVCEDSNCKKGYRFNNSIMDYIKLYKIPSIVLRSFGSNEYNNEKKEKLSMWLPCFNDRLLAEINNSLNTVGSAVLDILYNDEFLELSAQSIGLYISIQEKILNSSRIIYSNFEDDENIEYSEDEDRFLEIAEFLLKSNVDEKGKRIPDSNFASLDSIFFRDTVEFICMNDSQEVRKAKMEAFDKIKPQLLQHKITYGCYKQYLDFLSKMLKNKSEKEQINQLKAYGKYFANHNIEETFRKIKNSDNEEKIINLLTKCTSKKRTKQNLMFVDSIDQYSPIIVPEIVKRLENCQTKEQVKTLINCIKSTKFIDMSYSYKKQSDILNDFPGGEKCISEDNISISIPDDTYVEHQIISNGGEMTFKNHESGIKIKIKVGQK